MRKKIFYILILFSLVSCTDKAIEEDALRPNIILILADDLGYYDVGFNGGTEIKTPNIDHLADQGVIFTNGYVSYAVCGPSRAGLMTGRYQDRFGFSRNPLFAPKDTSQGLPRDQQTIAEALAPAGYRNMAIGKWHLGAHEALRPLKRGFHEFYGFLSGGHRYFPDELTLNDISEVKSQYGAYRTKLLRNNNRVEEAEYLTDALTREAINFIEANSGQPFFLYLAYNAPHGPLQATDEYLQRYGHISDDKRRTYAAMVSALDDGVGRILQQLSVSGLRENTLVIFLSDNGGQENLGADNGPLRKGKGSLFEGGIRVPFAMQWPGKITAGKRYDKPIISLDIFATIQGITGIKAKNELDGVDLIPFISGNSSGPPHDFLFWRKFDQKGIALRSANHKMVLENDSLGLYHVVQDLGESQAIVDSVHLNTLMNNYKSWNKGNIDPVFLGLLQNADYSEKNPDRFEDIERY